MYARTHLCSQLYTWKHTQRDTYYVYMHVHTDRRHRRQLKLTSCWPTPRGAVCMSVCECVALISLNTKYACISVFVCFYILPVVQLQCSFERLYKNFAISPLPPSSETVQCCIHGSLLLCERHSNDFVVQSTVQWGMSIYSSLRAISQQTQKLKRWQTEKYINNEYISLTHGVEEHWQEAWVYCMQ